MEQRTSPRPTHARFSSTPHALTVLCAHMIPLHRPRAAGPSAARGGEVGARAATAGAGRGGQSTCRNDLRRSRDPAQHDVKTCRLQDRHLPDGDILPPDESRGLRRRGGNSVHRGRSAVRPQRAQSARVRLGDEARARLDVTRCALTRPASQWRSLSVTGGPRRPCGRGGVREQLGLRGLEGEATDPLERCEDGAHFDAGASSPRVAVSALSRAPWVAAHRAEPARRAGGLDIPIQLRQLPVRL
jgi:hypothetical protein